MYKLIIVDDEKNIREGLAECYPWEELGFEVAAVLPDGKSAMEYIERYCVHAVLSDIRMPKLDGLELAKRLFSDYPGISVVLLSGYTEFEYARTAIHYGVKDYILKLYILEIYTLIDLRNYVAANKILAEAYEFVLLKDMRSYMYKLSYIKAHLYIFQEKMVNVSETCRLIELALEQLMSQYNNSLNDLKREIFLLIRLVQFTNTYKPGRIQTLILPFSFELQSLVEEVVNSLYDEDLLNMKSYFLFKNISFPNI